MRCCRSLYRHCDARNPHILLIITVGHPHVSVCRSAVAFLDATGVLRTVVLVVTAMALWSYFSVDKIQGRILQAVGTERDGKWPTVFCGVVNRGIGTVGESLSPYLTCRRNKAMSTLSRSAPCVSSITAYSGKSVFPESHFPSVGQSITGESLVRSLQRQHIIAAVCLFRPLHTCHRVGKYLITSLHESLVFRLLVIWEICIFLVKAMIVIYEIYRSERAVGLYLPYHATDAIAVGRVVFRCHRHYVVTHSQQLARLL